MYTYIHVHVYIAQLLMSLCCQGTCTYIHVHVLPDTYIYIAQFLSSAARVYVHVHMYIAKLLMSSAVR